MGETYSGEEKEEEEKDRGRGSERASERSLQVGRDKLCQCIVGGYV